MTTNILSPKWEGITAAPIDPSTMRFKPMKAPVYADCEGCLFVGQRSSVCRRACEIAEVDCDDPWPSGGSMIFVADPSDPRQLNLLDKEH